MQETADVTSMLPPGDQLRMKRIEFGLEIADVAQELFLSTAQLTAVEANDYENLPGPTYIIGYWRSYARLLNLDIDASIEFHRKDLTETSSGIVLEPNHQRAHGHQEKSRKRSAVLFLILAVSFICLLWYWQHPGDNPVNEWIENLSTKTVNARNQLSFDESSESNTVDEDPSNQIVELNIEKQPESVLPEPNFSDELENFTTYLNQSETSPEISPGTTAKQENSLPAEISDSDVKQEGPSENQETESTEPDTGEHTELDISNVEENVLPTVSVDDSALFATADIDAGSAETSAENADITFDVSSPDWIVLKVNVQTWLDVRDHSGKKLIYETIESGARLELHGQPPFAVFIGASTGVEVEYQGELVEFKPHKSGLFVRFLVGE